MASVPARILRWLLYLVAGVVIVLALGVGLLRLLLPLVPQYHEDIRAWASTATRYDIRFARISASWPLGGGPQLIFDDVTLTRPGEDVVSHGDDGPIGTGVRMHRFPGGQGHST